MIRVVDVLTGWTSTFVKNDDETADKSLQFPVAVSSAYDKFIYVADTSNHRILKCEARYM
jgi:hypothetical protein